MDFMNALSDNADAVAQKFNIDKKYAEDLIVDLIVKVKHDKAYVFDANVNFKWGTQAHVSGEDFDFGAALNKMMDVLDTKIKKEKDKVQEKK